MLTRTNSEARARARARAAATPTTPGASRSPRPSTRTPTPTSSRSATAGAATLALMGAVLVDGDGGPPRWRTSSARRGATGATWRCCTTRAAGRTRPSSCWSCRPWTTRSPRAANGGGTGGAVLTSRQGDGAPNPSLDPGRPRGHPPGGRAHRRRPRRLARRLREHPVTGHLIGGATIGDSAAHRRRRRLPPRLRPRRPARGRRLGRVGEPRRQPVAHHHRTGRAGHGAVAQPRRARSAAAPGAAYRHVAPIAFRESAVPAAAPAALRLQPRLKA